MYAYVASIDCADSRWGTYLNTESEIGILLFFVSISFFCREKGIVMIDSDSSTHNEDDKIILVAA